MPGFLDRLLGRRNRPVPAYPAEAISEDDPRIASGYAAVERYWQRVGTLDPHVVSHLVNPMFMGGPAWPNTRQAYRIVRTADSVIIASDGLSDPFVGTTTTDANGLGCEVYLETPDLSGAEFGEISGSWAFHLVSNWAQNVAAAGGINDQLAEHGVLSTEFPVGAELPAGWVSADGSVGLLLGISAPGRPAWVEDMPFAPVRMIPVTLIAAPELELVRSGGGPARRELVDRLVAAGHHHRSSLLRPAVV